MAIAARPVTAGASKNERLQAMVVAHHRQLWRFLRHLGLSEPDVDEALGELLLIAAEKLEAIEPDKERSFLMGTAYRVAKRMIERYARRAGTEVDTELVDDAPLPDALIDRTRARHLADEVLASMPVELRSVLVLFEVEELTTAEIAESLNLPQGTVASRLRRAREDFLARVSRIEARMRFKERVR